MEAKPQVSKFKNGALNTVGTIFINNRILGVLFIKFDLQDLRESALPGPLIATVFLPVTFLPSYVLTNYLEAYSAKPIDTSLEAMESVSAHADDSLRAATFLDDEIGTQGKDFNDMLNQILLRDTKVRHFFYRPQVSKGRVKSCHHREVSIFC